jgi:hypothetical protein
MKQLIIALLLLPLICQSQTLEYSEIHWSYDDRIEEKLHFKEVVETPNIAIEDIRYRITLWLNWRWKSKGIHQWLDGKTNNAASTGWSIAIDEPYSFESRYRIWTKYLTCDECIMVMKNAKKATPARYRLDLRLKEGKIQIVMTGFWGLDENVDVEGWMVKKGELILEQNDPRIEPLRTEFNNVVTEIQTFIQNPDQMMFTGKLETVKAIDNW